MVDIEPKRSVLSFGNDTIRNTVLHRFATAGSVVSAPRTSPRRLGVRLSSMQLFVSLSHGKVSSNWPSAFPFICEDATKNANRKKWKSRHSCGTAPSKSPSRANNHALGQID